MRDVFAADFFPTDFQIQVSRDNSNWASISSEWGYTPPFQPPYSDRWDFDGIDCRYLRITITKSKTLFLLFHLAQIAEIEVYGCDVEEDVPLIAEKGYTVNISENKSSIIKFAGPKNTSQGKLTTPGRPVVTFE